MNMTMGGLMLLGLACFCFAVFRGIGADRIINVDALLIILGGTTVALFVGFPARRILDACRLAVGSFSASSGRDGIVREIASLAKAYRLEGVKKLEAKLSEIDDDFLRLGVNLVTCGYRGEEIRQAMERELSIRIVHYTFSQNILRTVARLLPSLGLAGTVISLIKMFNNFQSLEAIAPFMAVALMSTFYGVILSNLVALPLAAKVKDCAVLTETIMEITIEGVLAIRDMEHPLKIEERLSRYNGHREEGSFTVKREFAPYKA